MKYSSHNRWSRHRQRQEDPAIVQVRHRGAPQRCKLGTHTDRQTDKQRTDATQKRGYTCCCRPKELYAAQRRTMPFADGDQIVFHKVNNFLCHQDGTPQAPHGHVCQGACGGRLHGNCGSMFDDHETKRICSTCVAEAGKRKVTPAESAGAGPSKRPKKTKGESEEGFGPRARPDNSAKLEIVKLMDESFVTT